MDELAPMDGLAPLAAADPFAKQLAAWRAGKLSTWERDFAAWDGTGELRHPPRPPTIGTRYEVKDELKMDQRRAAYRQAKAACDDWHTLWAEQNGPRKKGVQSKLDSQRDRAAEDA